MELLFNLAGINLSHFHKKDKLIFLAHLLMRLFHELYAIFKPKILIEKEGLMLEANFLSYLIKDILETEEYSLNGIAHYTRIPEEVIKDLLLGLNKAPSHSMGSNH